MSALAEKILRAREQRAEVGAHVFVIRRPTDVEMLALGRDRTPETWLRHVVGWDKVSEGDIIPGGDPHPLAFDAEACTLWLTDRADLLGPVLDKIATSYSEHIAAREQAQKN